MVFIKKKKRKGQSSFHTSLGFVRQGRGGGRGEKTLINRDRASSVGKGEERKSIGGLRLPAANFDRQSKKNLSIMMLCG